MKHSKVMFPRTTRFCVHAYQQHVKCDSKKNDRCMLVFGQKVVIFWDDPVGDTTEGRQMEDIEHLHHSCLIRTRNPGKRSST